MEGSHVLPAGVPSRCWRTTGLAICWASCHFWHAHASTQALAAAKTIECLACHDAKFTGTTRQSCPAEILPSLRRSAVNVKKNFLDGSQVSVVSLSFRASNAASRWSILLEERNSRSERSRRMNRSSGSCSKTCWQRPDPRQNSSGKWLDVPQEGKRTAVSG